VVFEVPDITRRVDVCKNVALVVRDLEHEFDGPGIQARDDGIEQFVDALSCFG